MSYFGTSSLLTKRAGLQSQQELAYTAAGQHSPLAYLLTPQGAVLSPDPGKLKQLIPIAAVILAIHAGLWFGSQHLPKPVPEQPKPKQVVVELIRPPEPIQPPKPLPPEVVKPKIPPIVPKSEPVKPQPQPIRQEPRQPVVKQQVIPEPQVEPAPEPVKQAVNPVPEAVKPAPEPVKPAPAPSPAKNEPVTEAKGYAGYLNNPAPEYPEAALERGWEGQVLLRVKVQPSGKPSEVSVKTGSGRKALDDAAVRTVKRWTFSPALRGTTPVEGWVDVPIVFQLPS